MMLAFTYVSIIEALLCILCTCVAEFSNPLVPYIVLCVDIHFPYVRIIGGHNSIQHHSFYYYAYEPPCFYIYIYILAIYKRNDNFHSSTCVLFYILLLLEQKKRKKKTSSVSCARSKKQRNISIPVYCFNF